MLKSYIKIAIRNLLRRKVYTPLNVIGLSTGLACAVFIFNWVLDESSYDNIPNKENIYRVVAEAGSGKDRWHQTVTSMPLGPAIESTYPEVEAIVRLDYNNAIVVNGDHRYIENNIVLTDPSFFDFFSYHLISGDEKSALSKPYQIVLTASMAEKYFGDADPIGQILKIYQYDPDGNGVDYEITGVIEDAPKTSHFSFNFLASISTAEAYRQGTMENWGNNSYYTYIQLMDQSDPNELEAKFPEMVNLFIGEQLERHDAYFRFYLQPITSIHLKSNLLYEIRTNGSMGNVWIFSAVGLFILLLAGINYVNLSTSIALERSKEIGVRKVFGAHRFNLMKQHIIETLILTLFSMMIAGLLVEIFKPFFQQLTGKYHITFSIFSLSLQLFVLCIPIGLIAGFFPAYFLSRLQAINALKGTIDSNSKNGLRSILVAFQFIITLIILVGLIVVRDQLNFVQSKDLGYDKTNLVVLKVNGDSDVIQGFEPFKNELISDINISHIGRSNSIITTGLSNSNGKVTHENGETQVSKLYLLRVDHDYIPTYNMQIVEGRNFSEQMLKDTTEVFILNEQAVADYGWSENEAIGKDIRYSDMDGKIIGVVNDFHFNSLHHRIEPLILQFNRRNFSRIIIKGIRSDNLLSKVEETWKKHFPNAIFDFTYQDQALFESYQSDQRFGKIFNIFSVLSMLIAFLGLFGLVGYTVTKRTKEIGIRKVLGASANQIFQIVSFNFLKIILLAAIIGFPFAWFIMDSWLDNFPYRINVEIWHFMSSALILLFVAIVIILFQSSKPIFANPTESLRES